MIFLHRIVLTKKAPSHQAEWRVGESKKLSEELERLLQCSSKAKYQPFKAFFAEVNNILSPQTAPNDLLTIFMKTLFPIYSHLQADE